MGMEVKTKKRKTWRCFHCDQVFRSKKSAWLHFGPDDGCEKMPAACVDPLRKDETARLAEVRLMENYARQCQETANAADDHADALTQELDEFKIATGCKNVHELRMRVDAEAGKRFVYEKLRDEMIQLLLEGRKIAQGAEIGWDWQAKVEKALGFMPKRAEA